MRQRFHDIIYSQIFLEPLNHEDEAINSTPYLMELTPRLREGCNSKKKVSGYA